MRTLLLSACVCLLAAVCSGAEYDAFKVTYNGYYDLPWKVEEAKGKWEKVGEDKQLNTDIYCQPGDPRVMLLFDRNGNVAGIRMAMLKDDVKAKAEKGGLPFDIDYDKNPLYTKDKVLGKDLWHTTALFVSPAKLSGGGRRKSFSKSKDDSIEGIFYRNNGKWTEISKEQSKISPDFSEGNCFAGMGKHYFYQLDANSDCKTRQPFFALYDQGKLLGFGLSGYGSFTKDPKTQSFQEDLPAAAAGNIVRNAPKCLDEYIQKYGLTTMHVYFKQHAPKVACA